MTNTVASLFKNGKRTILVADDEFINRAILSEMLQDEYDIITAENGEEAYDIIQSHSKTLSLILLDLIMPKMGGLELLSVIKNRNEYSGIPVIVLTTDQESEVVSLNTGASDFIPKPYPRQSVVKARIHRAIELSEDRQIISDTQNDVITGLYTGEYFYEYAEAYDKYHPDTDMDAVILGISNYNVLLERYGKEKCIQLLSMLANELRKQYLNEIAILCHKEMDLFFIYCHHTADHDEKLQEISHSIDCVISGVKLKMGIYKQVDKNLELRNRFVRARMAYNKLQDNYVNEVSVFDDEILKKILFEEQLCADFKTAISEEQFVVYFQPKFDITGNEPVIAGAEALVRWCHPELEMISPGLFIPLFESNGLIYELDDYVWHKTAAAIKDWRGRFDKKIPVSVNISRAEMYDPNLANRLINIVEENGIEISDLHLEITESAYVSDSSMIIDRVNNLRSKGFFIEMDDFGSGYSSLNMIGELPIDALKLDMLFIRSAFKNQNMKMLDIVIDIADCLEVPAIAEGVETEEQYLKLKESGCELIQGYYFSKPLPGDEFEGFLR
ncbi:EAL domain, c-di-GMP-specific phosphodiesterase class I (or its enzymatically inactive variant) [Ruminococcaceae bacterium YRB3002]|nr:EAL domain, c-di-GMP-specific phosphodiesterase class I (or its enzymatically inactive variant) [Ruminococcaceae bacterium YRB3002]